MEGHGGRAEIRAFARLLYGVCLGVGLGNPVTHHTLRMRTGIVCSACTSTALLDHRHPVGLDRFSAFCARFVRRRGIGEPMRWDRTVNTLANHNDRDLHKDAVSVVGQGCACARLTTPHCVRPGVHSASHTGAQAATSWHTHTAYLPLTVMPPIISSKNRPVLLDHQSLTACSSAPPSSYT